MEGWKKLGKKKWNHVVKRMREGKKDATTYRSLA